jgi:hypothetical protein
MSSKKYKELSEAYQKVYEQQIGVPLKEPTDRAAKEQLEKMIPKGEKVHIFKSSLQKAHYEPEGDIIGEDVYDQVLNYLITEGCTSEESNYIMSYIVEQGMHPQEVIGRGIANILGFDKPHPTQVFAQGLRKMLYPNKPQEVKAPKPPAPKLTKVASPAAKPTSTTAKPNPYRPGATIRATGPNLDKFPELQRFADQGRRIAEPVVKTAGALAALRNVTPYGVAAAVMAPRPTGDATLTAAMKRGDVAPPAPKLPAPEKPKPVVKPVTQKPPVQAAPKPKPKSVAAPKPASKPEVKGPQWPTLTPPPPVEKKPSLSDTVKDIRGAIERSKERQK